MQGYAIQCRVTTEDPENKFTPDYGRITHYRSVGGLGIRTDGGPAITGGIITPFYDSLLVKICAYGRRFIDAARRMERALQEFRVRGVKTNIPFLLNVVDAPRVPRGRLHDAVHRRDPRAVPVPGPAEPGDAALDLRGRDHGQRLSRRRRGRPDTRSRPSPSRPGSTRSPSRRRARASGSWRWAPTPSRAGSASRQPLLVTDTTFRDAHQSLLATRVRTRDMLRVADAYARLCPGVFSIEMWGGATFDTAMRFLKEDPWERLAQLRERIPNILFQMLLRGSNAVGYTSYPDNVVKAFVKEAAAAGIDLFRVFDSLNWVPNMELSLEAVREAGALCEAAICYTGDILDPEPPQVQPRVLRQPGQGAREARRQPDRDQGHGRPVQAVRRRTTDQGPARGGRRADPLPHARHRRGAGRQRPPRVPTSASTSPTAPSPRWPA